MLMSISVILLVLLVLLQLALQGICANGTGSGACEGSKEASSGLACNPTGGTASNDCSTEAALAIGAQLALGIGGMLCTSIVPTIMLLLLGVGRDTTVVVGGLLRSVLRLLRVGLLGGVVVSVVIAGRHD